MQDDETIRSNRLVAVKWRGAWARRRFRVKTITASIVFFAILLLLPSFFGMIEKRDGALLNDWVLNRLPAIDVSIPTFLIIWSMSLLLIVRAAQDPSIFLVFMCSVILSFFSRMISIMLCPLDPPVGLIPLRDPFTSLFYGGIHSFITKDLFYSGHTSIQFLMFLSLKKKRDKTLTLCASIAVGILVLVQHVHYTIDVVAAFVFTYLVYRWGRRIARY